MGISEEIEDAKINAEKTKISRLKRRSVVINHNSRDQIEHSDINTARKWRFTEIKGGLNLLKAGHPTLRHQIKVLKGG